MPQKKSLEEHEDIISEESSHKKLKTTSTDGNGTVEKNGKADEEIIDGVASVDEEIKDEVKSEVKNGKSTDEKLGVLLICGQYFSN